MTPSTLRSPKLGDVPYQPDDVLRFPDGLPGFERLREFLLVTREECAPFVFLASLEEPAVALPMLPWSLLSAEPVGDGDAVAAWAVVSIGHGAQHVIANLRAPIVIDLDARAGRQVILADEDLPVAAPVGT